MQKIFAKYYMVLFSVIAIFIFVYMYDFIAINAVDTLYPIEGDMYELSDTNSFDILGSSTIDTFCYGKKSLGIFTVNGDISENKTYNDVQAFGVNDLVTLKYSYNGSMNSKIKENWNITSSNLKKVAGIEVDDKVKDGIIIVQKSLDGVNWFNESKTIYDAFDRDNSKTFEIYKTSLEDIKHGVYIKVTVAYSMKMKTGEVRHLLLKDDVYEYRNFVESYTVFICSEEDYVLLKDADNMANILQNGAVVDKGFTIDFNDSFANINVFRDEEPVYVNNNEFITQPGVYKIVTETKLGKKYEKTITIASGLSLVNVSPIVREGKKNNGFEGGSYVAEKTSFDIESLTNLKIGHTAGSSITKSQYRAYDAYGVDSDSVSLFLNLNYDDNSIVDWKINEDTWGKKEKETVCGIPVEGAVGKGTIIVQTSDDGINWSNTDKDRYANGLNTTDFLNYYSSGDDILIYAPSGEDVIKGLFIRVLFAYQVNFNKKDIDCVEIYNIYLCSNRLDAITFSNNTIRKNNDIYVTEDKEYSKIKNISETLTDCSGTVTGFTVNKSLNPTVKCTIKRNGQSISVNDGTVCSENGKYDITLESVVGDSKTLCIYVDTSSKEDALENYFGDGFIKGRRIYDEGDYPVYEAGEGITSYNLKKLDDSFLPISGFIKNKTTGKEIKFDVSREARTGCLTEAGEYVAEFTTGYKDNTVGDKRIFTFNFLIIENGTAPGPVYNYNFLYGEFSNYLSDCYPIYYEFSKDSASKGKITLAFFDENEAKKYAYNYEIGLVEDLGDGKYRYKVSNLTGQKDYYDDSFELTDDEYLSADIDVHSYYFDMGNCFSYLSPEEKLSDSMDDLRGKKFDYSVIIFAEGQKKQSINAIKNKKYLPFINDKKYAYIDAGDGKKVVDEKIPFKFINIKDGIDSENVVIRMDDKKLQVNFDEGVEEQLKKADFPSGIIEITETNKYGLSNTYEAVYIKEGDNTGLLSLSYTLNNQDNEVMLSSKDENINIEANRFSIIGLADELDPYSLVIVKRDNKDECFFTAEQINNISWSDVGNYSIKILNRLGYSYSINVLIKTSDYSTIKFSGPGVENFENINCKYGDTNIDLPRIDMYGYDFNGYADNEGNVYKNQIREIDFSGTKELHADLRPKNIEIIWVNEKGLIKHDKAVFGSLYTLPNIAISEGYEMKGWTIQGKNNLYESNTIVIDSEDTVIFIPYIVEISTGNELEIDVQRSGNACEIILIIIAGIFIVFGGGRYILLLIRKKTVYRMVDNDK